MRIDRRRKLPVTTMLYALGLDQEAICDHFYNRVAYRRHGEGWAVPFSVDRLKGSSPAYDLVDAASGEVVAKAGQKLTPRSLKKIADDGVEHVLAPFEAIYGRFAAVDVINEETGAIYVEAGDELDEARTSRR